MLQRKSLQLKNLHLENSFPFKNIITTTFTHVVKGFEKPLVVAFQLQESRIIETWVQTTRGEVEVGKTLIPAKMLTNY